MYCIVKDGSGRLCSYFCQSVIEVAGYFLLLSKPFVHVLSTRLKRLDRNFFFSHVLTHLHGFKIGGY